MRPSAQAARATQETRIVNSATETMTVTVTVSEPVEGATTIETAQAGAIAIAIVIVNASASETGNVTRQSTTIIHERRTATATATENVIVMYEAASGRGNENEAGMMIVVTEIVTGIASERLLHIPATVAPEMRCATRKRLKVSIGAGTGSATQIASTVTMNRSANTGASDGIAIVNGIENVPSATGTRCGQIHSSGLSLLPMRIANGRNAHRRAVLLRCRHMTDLGLVVQSFIPFAYIGLLILFPGYQD